MEDCQALSELLSSSTSLEWLDIGENAPPSEAIELIISGPYDNTTQLIMTNSQFPFRMQSYCHQC